MRHYLFLSATLLMLTATYLRGQPEAQKARQLKINDELYYNAIAENVYMVTHYFPHWGGNSLIVLLKDERCVLIDTPYDGVATKKLLDWIRNTFGDLKISAIVTGFHQDNLGGNEILIQQNIPVYGMQLTAELVEEEREEFKKVILKSVEALEDRSYYERYEKLNLLPPDHTFQLDAGESKVLEIGEETFEFFYPGETHTADNAVVYIHGQKLLFGGCMIRALRDSRPGYIAYANMQEWPASVERVAKKFPNSQIVIPGHGFEGDVELLSHTIEILNTWNQSNSE